MTPVVGPMMAAYLKLRAALNLKQKAVGPIAHDRRDHDPGDEDRS